MNKQIRGDRVRRRPKRRGIFCLNHPETYLESRSRKLRLFAIEEGQLSAKSRRKGSIQKVLASNGAQVLPGEWLEQFWCPQCQVTAWYHVTQKEQNFAVSPALSSFWKQVSGVSWPGQNPTVSQYSQNQAHGNRL
ncbi:hypothetical protein G7B40_030940 [Aetokthonos hydrillicola Thurmond2011]|jgi:hypothetical protein|uniref:Uncharacterized protein n=1 Tax=Aetokthonos hydrillicola Thurmond2011 TaxID=2712845 RepID=A0AAP5M8A5_9CYAN|nr:hypothetical protein [Aetokthonos hydrillicola]MBW4589687.1 hypothetical protein [Aetokthonos hydrillicola CCALA 1050]MDR9898941.1 hypothetical protein [Aetokthonos hydrillicola Thurmond2011]